jgi:hypothetical protein
MSEKDVTEVTATTDTAVDEVAAKLVALGLTNDQVTKVKEDLGVATVEDLSLVTEEDLKGVGLKPIAARRAADGLKPVADATAPAVDMAASLASTRHWLPRCWPTPSLIARASTRSTIS